jgi:hypothetical protein
MMAGKVVGEFNPFVAMAFTAYLERFEAGRSDLFVLNSYRGNDSVEEL